MKNFSLPKLIISIAIVLLIGFAGSFFTSSSVDGWYQTISKPSFNPPSWLFAPVWTVLYIMIGISLYLVWISPAKNKTKAYAFFAIQLALNLLWSIIFFGNHQIGLALAEIILLWLAILGNIIYTYKISKLSSYLLIPYILWVSFAAFLNFTLWKLNA